MLGVMRCPECGEEMNVDLVREFTQVRCSGCGKLLDRDTAVLKTRKGKESAKPWEQN